MFKHLVALLLLITHQTQSQDSYKKPPTAQLPVLFTLAPINTNMNERDIAISPDGKEMFYTVVLQPTLFHTILYCKKDNNGNWTAPQVASFSGIYSDMEPAFSPDGKKLFFSSNRPDTLRKIINYDIWYVEKSKNEWINPKNLGPEVNTASNEYYPSVASNGNLYFTAEYDKGTGKEDIFICKLIDGKYSPSIPLDTGINSPLYEFNAFVSPDESYILFTSFGRKDDKGRGDIYFSSKDDKGNWLPAKNLAIVNSDKLDYCPFVSFDSKTLFFTSERHLVPEKFNGNKATYEDLKRLFQQRQNGTGNIYQVSWEAVLQSIH